MTRSLQILAVCVLFAVSSLAQERPLIGTVVDVDEGRNRLQLELDDVANTTFTIETDAVSTTYHGFGTVIAGKPEIFTGSRGLANVRVGDRIEVRGPLRSESIYRADRVILLGRDVPAPTVGVGETRDPARGAVATPTDDRATGVTPTVARVEGTVREINEREGRIVLQTTDRRLITVLAARNTAVWYRGERYGVANLEVGDRVRIEHDVRNTQADEITARRIDVTQSVQDASGGTAAGTAATVTVLDGRVTRVEQGLDYIYVDDGRGEVRVDMRSAADARGDIIRARDVRVGDRVEMSGSYNRAGDLFLASTVRFGGAAGGGDEPGRDPAGPTAARYGLVTLNGTVTGTLEDGATIAFRDRDSGETVRIWVSEDFVVRTRGNTYTTAESLRVNDTALVTAFRDVAGYYVAQTIRLRNR